VARHFVPFLGLVVLLVAIPGPAVVLIMKNAVLRGRNSALLTAAGVFVADLIWVVASVSGVTAALVASKPAFVALRWVGAAYLVYLGVGLVLRRGVRPLPENPSADRPLARSGSSVRRAFREGVICDLSNPKTVLVFTSVIPQFVPSTGGPADVAELGIIFALLGFLSLLLYAVVLGSAHRAIRRPRLADGLLQVGGGILVAFGVGLAIEPSD
jgi:threonine/homoserine/homoserine lactone efflux protein